MCARKFRCSRREGLPMVETRTGSQSLFHLGKRAHSQLPVRPGEYPRAVHGSRILHPGRSPMHYLNFGLKFKRKLSATSPAEDRRSKPRLVGSSKWRSRSSAANRSYRRKSKKVTSLHAWSHAWSHFRIRTPTGSIEHGWD